jgi:hypothetical protein
VLFWKNSTWLTAPSGSEAVAPSEKLAGALNTLLFGGLVTVTTGGRLVTVTEPVMEEWKGLLQWYG